MRRSSVLAFPFLLVSACERRSDEELRAMIGDVVQQHVEAAGEKQDAEKNSRAASEDEISALEKRIDELQARVAMLEARPLVPPELAALSPDPRVEAPTPTVPAARVNPGEPDPSATYKIPIGESHTKGFDDALVTVIVWSDFECPYCSRVDSTFQRIKKAYGADVRFAFKHCPLSGHARAKPAAIAAEAAAEQGKFWEMHDKLFENHTDLSDANFLVWASELGLDVKRFERDLADAKLDKRVQDQRDECSTFGVVGVPSFHVNGRYVSDGSFEGLSPVIDEEKKRAEKLVAAGAPPEGVYDAAIATGKTGA